MRFVACVSVALATLALYANTAFADLNLRIDPEPAWRKADGILELSAILETWLDENTDLQRLDGSPRVKLISSATAASMKGIFGLSHGRTRGLFDRETSTIFLIQPWDPKDAHDASVLLHELVHYRQTPHYFYCPGAQERAAYQFQDDWLRIRGLRANVNWIAVVLEAGCTPKDIHPD